MKLHIENFAKISSADIQFDGLTVIAGDNNTGKSTVGKILYAVFRGLSNLDKRIRNARMDALRQAFADVPGYEMIGDVIPLLLKGSDPVSLISSMIDAFWNEGSKIGIPRPDAQNAEKIRQSYVNVVNSSLEKSRALSDDDYGAMILARVFDCVFHKQYRPLQASNGRLKLVLTVKGEENVLENVNSKWSKACPTKLMSIARLIATPDILSLINVPEFDKDDADVKYFDKYTSEIVRELRKTIDRRTDSERIASEKALQEIYAKLDVAIRGAFQRDEQNDLSLFENGHLAPTKAANLSMGLKAFVLLRHMLERGVLSEKDVLILDEPENHLHPEWQVIYAQAVVLLQKAFHLTLLVTSHSQFFVNALQRFAISEGIADKTHFYLSKEDVRHPGFFTFEDKGRFASHIMRSFGHAYDLMGDLSGESEEDAACDPEKKVNG